ncbi:MAG: murein L,D-transpeptidase [Chitinispirillaceae bacterium]|nr:murein L,D-transpeptidase [Chitinispirillaceae bacterium]
MSIEPGLKTIPVILSVLVLSTLSTAQIHSSARSIKAIARVKPLIERDLAVKGLAWGLPVFIRLFKETDTLELWMRKGDTFALFKSYPVCTYGTGELGPKESAGDGIAPEGFYAVSAGQLNPYSQFHLAFNIGYPNAYDRVNGRTGSAIMIHGNCVSIGCFAMTDPAIEEIYALVDAALRAGQQSVDVHIFPFRMTDDKVRKYENVPWAPFWRDLREGYACFETTRVPPKVRVSKKRYVFSGCRR